MDPKPFAPFSAPSKGDTRRGTPNVIKEGDLSFVPHDHPAGDFARTILGKEIARPQVIISVTGGAQHFKMLPTNLEKIFNRGILKAAENSRAMIVTGGMNSGVMEFVGKAIREMDLKVTCVGIATFNKISSNALLQNGGRVFYSSDKKQEGKVALQQDHTHFILIKSDSEEAGQSTKFRRDMEHYYATHESIPTVVVALNGNLQTIRSLLEAARRQMPIIIVEQSGRACDGMAAFIKHKDDNKRHKLDAWEKLFKTEEEISKREKATMQMEELYTHRDRITIFNPSQNVTEDMDKIILRSIMGVKVSGNFYGRMELGVQWGRADLIEELLRQEDSDVSPQEKTDAINRSLQQALLLNKPDIYELLIKKGADKDSIDLIELYDEENAHIDRLMPYAGVVARRIERTNSGAIIENTALLNSEYENSDKRPEYFMDIAKRVLYSIDEMYEKLFDDRHVSFTDALVWAIFVNRPELAKAIWRNMEFPVHSALLACHLYSVLARWFKGEEVYKDCRDWFENEAIAVLSQATYEQAIPILRWKWKEIDSCDALEIAEVANCKEFTALPYVQRYLDKKQYHDEHGHVPPGTSMWRVLLLAMFPFLLPFVHTYKLKDGRQHHYYHFYNLPVVKIVTSTLCYIIFLALITLNVIESAPGRYNIEWYEIILWIWVFALLIEEVVQYIADKENYFDALSNQIDLFTNVGLIVYIVLRFFACRYRDDGLVEAYCNVLLVSNILCYIRLTTVFAVSKSLGPLFFVIIRLFVDVIQWLFVFMVFMLGFQIGIFALTRQAHQDPWSFFPKGTLGVGISTIIAQVGDNTLDWMQDTYIGVGLLIVYCILSQVMLVNLLIAMMADTYSTVKANADKEWKFYRYGLITEYTSTSSYPPPFNLVLGPISYFHNLMFPKQPAVEKHSANTLLHMKIARNKTIEHEKEVSRNTIQSLSAFVRESTRISANYANGEKLFLESNMKSLHKFIDESTKKQNQMFATIQHLQQLVESQQQTVQLQQKQMAESLEMQQKLIATLQNISQVRKD